MEEQKFRCVRCPKCAKVLIERSDYSVYRCGGCSTILRAKTGVKEVGQCRSTLTSDVVEGARCSTSNSSYDICSEERTGEVIGNLESFPEKGTVNKNCASEVTKLKSTSGSFKGNPRLLEDPDGNVSNSTVDKWVAQNDFDMNSNSDDLGCNPDLVADVGQMKSQVENSSGSVKYEEESAEIRDGVEVEQRPNTLRSDVVQGASCSTSNSNYPDEGSSSDSHMGHFYSYGYALSESANLDIHNRVESLNQDRAELLRKLDELRDQLTRSCIVSDKLKRTSLQDAWLPDGSLGLGRPDMAFHGDFYPAMHTKNYAPMYGDPYGSRLPRRGAPHPVLPNYHQQPPHPCFSGHYLDTDLDGCVLHSHNSILNQSSCSCLDCYGRHWDVPGPLPSSTAFCNKGFPDVPNVPTFYNLENQAAFHIPGQPTAYNPRSATIPPLSLSQDPFGRWLSNLNYEMGGFAGNRPKTALVPSPEHRLLPLAGGAPFITCRKCFEVLQIPKKVLVMKKNKQKLQCAVCSAVIVLAMVEKKLIAVSPSEDTKPVLCEVDEGSNEAMKDSLHSHGHLIHQGRRNICSDDSGCDLQSENIDQVPSSAGQNQQSTHSSSVSTSGVENYPNGLVAPRDAMELPGKGLLLPPPPGSTLQEYFDYSSNKLTMNHLEEGNQGMHSEQDEMVQDKTTLRKNSFGRLIGKSSMNFHSSDSGYDLQSVDREPILSSTGHDVQSINSLSLNNSRHENFPDDSLASGGSMEVPVKSISPPPSPPGSLLREHLIYPSNNLAANRIGKGDRSIMRSDQDNMVHSKAASRQNSIKDVSLETETEVSFNEYSTTETSQGSTDVSREDQPRINNKSDSFFTGVLKKSFSKSNQMVEVRQSQTRVTINEHPVPDMLVEKAEKLAGPIHPGNFWYDSRAGFWGVMGGPCLGIIPPFIEEFNYPMPVNCAGGNTGVIVNGRELHQKDLSLLVSRGFPTDRDRSYIVEISGKVRDMESGEELKSLGTLAPTVLKAKRGFGMKVGRAAAA